MYYCFIYCLLGNRAQSYLGSVMEEEEEELNKEESDGIEGEVKKGPDDEDEPDNGAVAIDEESLKNRQILEDYVSLFEFTSFTNYSNTKPCNFC